MHYKGVSYQSATMGDEAGRRISGWLYIR